MTDNWLKRQNRDPFVREARRRNLRGRAAFKLEEIDEKYRLIKPADTIVDLGAAPGGWSQYAARRAPQGRIIAVDLLPMPALRDVTFIQGDLTDADCAARIRAALPAAADLVLSDMAPNITGIGDVDQARYAVLSDCVLDFCRENLKSGGGLLFKIFAGESFDRARAQFARQFAECRVLKPRASRLESKEVFLLGLTHRDNRL